ncbi:MAG: hypothetical protein CMN80_03060 [Spongiibacter sp.]|uniref:MbcA/ParS/Xre antitoxin family protein n=1 Tax=Spongiibacter sp. TaxID=2024860 RepID=UPI000C0A56B0|nr:MbcA/ParS/Xre antitoxin family protein [Spongiibacter sp.]MAK43119.1 hypothetical protein [Spongiibacter sp.]
MSAAITTIQQNPRTGAVVLPVVFSIFDKWGLTGSEKMTLLGLVNERTLYNWIGQPGKASLTPDAIERISYILGIFKALEILLPDPDIADRWLSTPNDNSFFNGTAPKERMLAGMVVDLAAVRSFLDNPRGIW